MLITLPASLTFIAGVIMMLPAMSRRAAARGMSGDIIVPGGYCDCWCSFVFDGGLYLRRRVFRASPFAFASGRALVNQARFAVSAMRLPSLTRPAVAGLFQAFGFSRTDPHPVTRLLPLHFLEMLCKPFTRRSSRPLAGLIRLPL